MCNDDIPGIGVTHSESRKFLNLEDITIPHFVETKDNQPVSPNCVLKVEHLVSVIHFYAACHLNFSDIDRLLGS